MKRPSVVSRLGMKPNCIMLMAVQLQMIGTSMLLVILSTWSINSVQSSIIPSFYSVIFPFVAVYDVFQSDDYSQIVQYFVNVGTCKCFDSLFSVRTTCSKHFYSNT